MVQWQDVDPGDRPGDRDQSYRPTPIWDHAGAPTVIRQTQTPAIQSLKQRQGNVGGSLGRRQKRIFELPKWA